jgi:transposase
MKLWSTCRCIEATGRIIKPISGSTADREQTVVFDFRLGRGRDGPKQFRGQFEGLLQTDGYAAYDQIGGPKMVHAGCWSHAEQYFSEAVQLNPQDPMATAIVARIDELFAIDAEARHALRQQQSRPLLGEIRKQIEAARSMALPVGALAEACNYTLTCGTNSRDSWNIANWS